ncbi:MAG: DegT/DnrJ/EryC1/StrS family aminotransferase [Chloroflexota bacterium]
MTSRRRSILRLDAQHESSRILRTMTGRRHALLAGRGAAGIWAALRALDLHDAYVMIPANTCYIVLWAVLKSGNKPLLVDVDGKTGNLSPPPTPSAALPVYREGEINSQERKAKAIITCHMYGIPAPMGDICEWARAENVNVIEDAALALGAQIDGRPAGAWGDVSAFSFGLGKITDNQVGGAVLTDDDRLAADIERLLAEMPVWDDALMGLTNQWNALYWALHQYEADNPRLLDLYPALYNIYGDLTGYRLPPDEWWGLPDMLRDLPANLAHRAAMAAVYDNLLSPSPLLPVALSASQRGGVNTRLHTLERLAGAILWRYPLLVEADVRDELLHYLWDNGVQDTTRWYPPLRYMTAALAPDVPQPPTPNADALGASIINLRVDPGIDRAHAERTAGLIQAFFAM